MAAEEQEPAGTGPVRSRPDPEGPGGWGWWLGAVGYLLVVAALVVSSGGPDAVFTGRPTCDGQPMAPGDDCRITVIAGSGSSIQDFTYAEMLEGATRAAKEGPWQRGQALGAVGVVLVFVSVGRHLTGRLPHTGQAAFFAILLSATAPLLAATAVVWSLERRYDRTEFGELSLLGPGPVVPVSSLIMFVLILLATLVTVAVITEDQALRERRLAPQAPPDPWPTHDPQPFGGPPPVSGLGPGAVPRAREPAHPAMTDNWQALMRPAAGATSRPAVQAEFPHTVRSLIRAQFAGSVAGTVLVGVLSRGHVGIIVTALVGLLLLSWVGADPATPPGYQLATRIAAAVLQVVAVGATAWLGIATGRHAGVILLVWLGVTAAIVGCATLVGDVHKAVGSDADRPQAVLVAGLVPALLLPVIGIGATTMTGRASSWSVGTVLAVWSGVLAASVTYALTAVPPGAGAPLRQRDVLGAALAPVGLVLGGAVATMVLGDASGWAARTILPLWAGIAIATIIAGSVRRGVQRRRAPFQA